MIKIIGYELPTKGGNIQSISNTIPDGSSCMAESLACKTCCKKIEGLEGISRVGAGGEAWNVAVRM